MGITELLPGVHQIAETPIVRVLRRRLGDPDLVTYYNRETGEWALGYWLSRVNGVVDEIDGLGPNFEAVTPDFITSLEQTRGSTTCADLKRLLVRNAKRRAAKQYESQGEQMDAYNWAKKRVGDKAPVPYAFG